jgi:hypothetical protein
MKEEGTSMDLKEKSCIDLSDSQLELQGPRNNFPPNMILNLEEGSKQFDNEQVNLKENSILSSKQPINKKKTASFNSKFLQIKKKIGLPEEERKTKIDSMLKKSNCKFYKSVHLAIKRCLKSKVERLPQKFITNIKIQFIKKYLNKTLLEIYQENSLFLDFDHNYVSKNSREGKSQLIKEFFALTLNEAFQLYTTSKQYLKEYESISVKEGQQIAELFDYVSKIFIDYYTKSKGNTSKREMLKNE